MPYSYQEQRKNLFTEEGSVLLMEVNAKVERLLKEAGAVRMQELSSGFCGSSWTMMAAVDRLVEMKKLREVTPPGSVYGQYRVFVAYYT